MKDRGTICIKCRKWYKNFKSITKLLKHNKASLSTLLLKKIYKAESTDESESLSYKSRYNNKSEKNKADRNYYGIFNIPLWYCFNCNVLLQNKPSLFFALSLSPCH